MTGGGDVAGGERWGPLASRAVALRPVRAGDVEWLYELLTFEAGSRWRYRGRTPSHGEFAADLWRGVHSQFVVCTSAGEPVGLVGLVNANHAASHCHAFAVGAPGRGDLVSEGFGLLLDWAFAELDFDKVWIEAPEFNLEQFAGLRRYAAVEGRLRDHDHWRGRFWDLLILAVERTTWLAGPRDLIERAKAELGRSSPGSPWADVNRILAGEWPPDSLGRVELRLALEEVVERPVASWMVDLLSSVPASEAAAHVEATVADLRSDAAPDQQERSIVGRREASGKGQDPSLVACTSTASGDVDITEMTRQDA